MSSPASAAGVEATYKARDVEGLLDIYFYRPIGFALARLFAALRFSPSGVSILGGAIGVVAGHLYFYPSLRVNVAGMLLHIGTNALDNADGQLARLTNRGSLTGAVVDGFADYIVFISVYVHLALRHIASGGSPWICLVALLAGASHAVQSLAADCFRDAYLFFVHGKRRGGTEDRPPERWAARVYADYTRGQQMLAPYVTRLRETVGANVSPVFAARYRELCRPLIPWGNALATNARMLTLFAVLMLGAPSFYFAIELTVLNGVLFYLLHRERSAHAVLLHEAAAARS